MAKLRSIASLVLLLLLAAGVSIYVLREMWNRESPAYPAPTRPSTSSAPQPEQTRASSPAETPPVPALTPDPSKGYAQQLLESEDYLRFARSIHEAAKSGDADAQYHLYWVLDYCRKHYGAYFGRPEKPRTLDEGLRWAVAHPSFLDVEEGRIVYRRCVALVDPALKEFGDLKEWLQKAAVAGQPNAQMTLARDLAFTLVGAEQAQSMMPAQAESMSVSEKEIARVREAARAMAVEALSSRDPLVIAEAASVVAALGNGEPPAGEYESWLVAACLRGLDCSPSAERTKTACRFIPNCQPYESLVDMLSRQLANTGSLEDRAREINRLIDAGDWEALGLRKKQP